MVRILNVLLLLTAIVGVVFATRANLKFESTRSEHKRLTAKAGRLPIEDATKVHVLALETGDLLDFAWQVYVPANFIWKWQTTRFQSGSSTSSGTQQEMRMEIVRVRFRKIDGQWHVWNKFVGSSGQASYQDAELLDQPELLSVQQLGVGNVRVLEPDEIVTLLSISAEQPSGSEDHGPAAFVGRFGSQAAWASQQKTGN